MKQTEILLGHLNSMGDCLFASIIARQIKEVDYPNCRLTWAVNSKCKPAAMLSPYIDEIWEIPTERALTGLEEWNSFAAEAEKKRLNGEFDLVFTTQIIGENWLNYDGGIRSSIYNNYPREIVVSHQPIVRLSEKEVENVRLFAEKHKLAEYKNVVLVECAPESFDNALSPRTACEFASAITSENAGTAVILSSNKRIESTPPNIIDASELSFRENAELTKYCDLFVGCASGISWLATSDWAKKMNMILVINQQHSVLASMIYDHEYLNLPTDHIIEIKNNAAAIEKLKNCVGAVLDGDFAAAKNRFSEKIRLTNYDFLFYQFELASEKADIKKFFAALRRVVKRNGRQIFYDPSFLKTVGILQLKAVKKFLKSAGAKKNAGLAG